METTAVWELAVESIVKVAVIAAILSNKEGMVFPRNKRKMPMVKKLGELSSTLMCVSVVHDKCEDQRAAPERVHQLLESLEQLCKFECPPQAIQCLNLAQETRHGYPILEALKSWTQGEDLALVDMIAGSLKAFASPDLVTNSSGPKTARQMDLWFHGVKKSKSYVRDYLDFLKNFSSTTNEPGSDAQANQTRIAGRSAKDAETPSDFPAHVHKTLFNILIKKYSQCCCARAGAPTGPLRQHEGSLKLRENIQIINDHVVFDIVLSRSPRDYSVRGVEWQHLQFHIPRKQAGQGQVGFAVQDVPSREPTKAAIGVQSATAIKSASQFCELLQERIGPAKICLQAKGDKIFQMADLAGVDDDIAHKQGITLADILQRTELVTKKRLLLTYMLAKSFWQFYNSDWMSVRWTTETVQFFYERRGEEDDDDPGVLDGSPYISLPTAANTPSLLLAEHLPTEFVVHRYPRLLALGILLLKIGRQKRQTNTEPEYGKIEERISHDLNNIKRALKERWPKLKVQEEARRRLREVLLNCSNPKLFEVDGKMLDIEDRRAIIYRQIVYPLKLLLEEQGWVDTLGNIQCQEDEDGNSAVDRDVGSHESTVAFLNAGSISDQSQSNQKEAKKWLERIQNSEVTRTLFSEFNANHSINRIRIAILDTGYDPETLFFSDPSRKRRIQSWKDMVTGDSTNRRDEDGHGTHVLSLLMKVIPAADFYVARVARSTGDLANSTDSVARAIKWAAEEHQADIISMSFGFDHEILVDGKPAISNAISEALRIRDQQILFFAAAANEGGNQPEMFPANHPQVISIRGTDHRGWLQRFNYPKGNTGIDCFMTLAQDVPGAGLSRDGGNEVCKSGTSVSTPIAAGIAAMLLSYARLYGDDLKRFQGGKPALSTFSGMHSIFKKMSTDMNGFYYLTADNFLFKGNHESRLGWMAT